MSAKWAYVTAFVVNVLFAAFLTLYDIISIYLAVVICSITTLIIPCRGIRIVIVGILLSKLNSQIIIVLIVEGYHYAAMCNEIYNYFSHSSLFYSFTVQRCD